MVVSKSIIIGSNGFIGRHLKQHLPDSLALSRKDLDLCHPNISSLPIEGKGYTHAFILAACANISFCENNPKESYLCNLIGTLELTKQLLDNQIKPILFSSDYVFDGRAGNYSESSPLSPITKYGEQKAELEEKISSITGGNHLLLRLSKIYSLSHDGSLLDEMASSFLNGCSIRVAYDQIFSPLLVNNLIKIMLELMKSDLNGTFNIGGKKAVSRLSIAETLAANMQVSKDLIEVISLDSLNESFSRPKNTSLNVSKIFNAIPIELAPIEDHIRNLCLTVTNLTRTLF